MELNKREQTAHLIAMSEVKKRHDKLRALVEVVKQGVNELKCSADSKLEEARALSTSIEERSLEVEAKLCAVDAKLAEVSTKTSKIEAKESSLMKERMSFYNERDAHERNISKQREGLREREKKLQEGEEKLAGVRRLLNQREELANDGDREFKQKQYALEEAQKRIDVANSELKSREDDISTRMENLALKEKEAAVFSKNLKVREKELELEEKLNARKQLFEEQFEKEFSETKELLKREQTAHLIAMSEVKKQEERLWTALGVEKQRVNELEIAVREMRSEHAKIKFNADSKLEEAHALSTSIEGRLLEVEAKLHAVDAKLAEVSRKKSSEIEAKESSLMRERLSFSNEEDSREQEKKLQEGEEKLAEVRRLLNQREELANDCDRVIKQRQLVLADVIRASTSKPREKQEMMQTKTTRNWLDLTSDLQINILRRVVTVEKLWIIPKVCREWREICEDPSMWKVIYMDSDELDCWPYPWPPDLPVSDTTARKMCRIAVDRSQGQLVDITMIGFCDDELLQYVADRSPQLKRLEIAYPNFSVGNLSKALKLPKLEEMSIHFAGRLQVDLTMGSYCPELRTLRLNACYSAIRDEEIIWISENLRHLRHLELHQNNLSNTGLQAILDGCLSLEVLDLRLCPLVDLKGVCGKRLEQITCVLHTEPVDIRPYSKRAWFMDLKAWRKITFDGKIIFDTN